VAGCPRLPPRRGTGARPVPQPRQRAHAAQPAAAAAGRPGRLCARGVADLRRGLYHQTVVPLLPAGVRTDAGAHGSGAAHLRQ